MTPPANLAAPVSHLPCRVLVVDDTATNRQILAHFLKKLGHTVELAVDGADAVAKFTAKPSDIVIMDVMMPVMDGYEATRRIKALCGDQWVPVIFLSALNKDENLVAGLDAGGDDYLPKPVNFTILEAKLRSLTRTLALRRELDATRRNLQVYHDEREAENTLAADILEQIMQRPGLSDPRLHYWISSASSFSGDILAATASVDGRFIAAAFVCIDPQGGNGELWLGGMPAALMVDASGKIVNQFDANNLPLGVDYLLQDAVTTMRIDCRPTSGVHWCCIRTASSRRRTPPARLSASSALPRGARECARRHAARCRQGCRQSASGSTVGARRCFRGHHRSATVIRS